MVAVLPCAQAHAIASVQVEEHQQGPAYDASVSYDPAAQLTNIFDGVSNPGAAGISASPPVSSTSQIGTPEATGSEFESAVTQTTSTGSGSTPITPPVTVKVPNFAGVAEMVMTTVLAAGASVPRSQLIVLTTWKQPGPAKVLMFVPSGNVALNLTLVAGSGPLFLTENV